MEHGVTGGCPSAGSKRLESLGTFFAVAILRQKMDTFLENCTVGFSKVSKTTEQIRHNSECTRSQESNNVTTISSFQVVSCTVLSCEELPKCHESSGSASFVQSILPSEALFVHLGICDPTSTFNGSDICRFALKHAI